MLEGGAEGGRGKHLDESFREKNLTVALVFDAHYMQSNFNNSIYAGQVEK